MSDVHLVDIAYWKGYAVATSTVAEKVKEAFNALPGTSDSTTRDLLLDLYNDITRAADSSSPNG